MSDVITTLKAITPNAAEIAYASAIPADLPGMLNQAQEKAAGLFKLLNQLLAAFPTPGDANQAIINGLAGTLLATGQLNFSLPQNSGHLLTIRVFA